MISYLVLSLAIIIISIAIHFIYLRDTRVRIGWRSIALLVGLMLIFDSILTGLPIVIYNAEHTLGILFGTIPIEDFSYLIVCLIITPALFYKLSTRD